MQLNPLSPRTRSHGARRSLVERQLTGLWIPSFRVGPLHRALARLLSPPSSKQQLAFLRRLSPALFARGGGAPSEIELFLEASSARFEMRVDDTADTALHVAAYAYDSESLAAMILSGVDVDVPDTKGRTPLHYACDVVDQLAGYVYKFSDPQEGSEPLLARRTTSKIRMAADLTQAEAVRELSAAQLRTVRLLLAAGANASAQASVTGSMPLHLAARSGALATVRTLLGAGASLSATNRHGMTPLHVASAAGHADVCLALLHAGADTRATDAWGRDARWYVEAAGAAMSAADAARVFGQATRRRPLAESSTGWGTSAIGGGWAAADRQVPASWGAFAWGGIDVCELDRVSDDALSSEAFESDYLVASRPVAVAGGARHMRAKQTFGRRAFFERFGAEVFGAQKLPTWKGRLLRGKEGEEVPLATYFERVASGAIGDAPPLAWNNPRNMSLWAEVEAAEMSWPPSLDVASRRRDASNFGLFLGPRRSGISMHHHKAGAPARLDGPTPAHIWLPFLVAGCVPWQRPGASNHLRLSDYPCDLAELTPTHPSVVALPVACLQRGTHCSLAANCGCSRRHATRRSDEMSSRQPPLKMAAGFGRRRRERGARPLLPTPSESTACSAKTTCYSCPPAGHTRRSIW